MRKICSVFFCLAAVLLVLSSCAKTAEEPTQTTEKVETTTQAAVPTVRLGVTSSFELTQENYTRVFDEAHKAESHGIYVSDLEADSPLNGTGFRRGDVIQAIDGKEVNSFAEIKAVLCDYAPGDTAQISAYRCNFMKDDYHPFTVTVTFPKEKGETTKEDSEAESFVSATDSETAGSTAE